MIKLKTIFNVTPKHVEKWFNEFMETYPNGYKGHTINEHNGLYDVTIAYEDMGTVKTSSKKVVK